MKAAVAIGSCTRLADACARIGLEVLPGRTERGDVALVLASLPAGERTIPQEAADLAERSAVPLILASAEALVRPTVLLDDQRVLVTAPDATDARLEGALRMFLAEGRLGKRTWSADFGAVTREDAADGSTSAHLPFGEIRLAADSMRWSFRWPEDKPLWLYSPVRIPHLIDLSAIARQVVGTTQIAADVGDLVFGASLPMDARAAESLFAGGGPFLLAHLAIQPGAHFSITEVV